MNSKKRVAFTAISAAGLVAPLALTMAPAHADSDAGYLIGTVVDNTGHPVPGATVEFDRNGSDYTEARTDRNGRYVASLSRSAISGGGTWTATASAGGFDDSADQPVGLPPYGSNGGGPSFTLTPTAFTEDLTGVLLTGAVTTPNGFAHYGDVEAFDAATGADIADAYIEPNGHFYFDDSSLAGRTIKLSFGREDSAYGAYNDIDGYAGTFLGGGTSKAASPAITVPAAGQPPLVVNGALTALATITGAVRLPAAGANWEAYATLYDQDGNEVGDGGSTDAAGNFSIDVPPGTYYLRADGDRFTEYTPPGSTTPEKADTFGFVAGYYGKNATSLATAAKIVVGANQNKSVGTIVLTNALHATEKPFIKVKKGLRAGGKLSVDQGIWNHQADLAYSYAWKVGNKTLSTKPSLKINKKVWKKLGNGKKAKKLTVTVTATDKYGELVNGSVKQKVVKALAKEQKQAAKEAKQAQKQANKVKKQTGK